MCVYGGGLLFCSPLDPFVWPFGVWAGQGLTAEVRTLSGKPVGDTATLDQVAELLSGLLFSFFKSNLCVFLTDRIEKKNSISVKMPVVRWTSCNFCSFLRLREKLAFFFSKLLFVTVTVVNKVWKCFPLWSVFLLSNCSIGMERAQDQGATLERGWAGESQVLKKVLTYLSCRPL